MSIPVRVYGRTTENRPFRDVTETNTVSVHGGLLVLAAKVQRGQTVLLVNAITQEERKIGVEFTNSSGDFWHVYPSLIDSK